MKKIICLSLTSLLALGITGLTFAMCGTCGMGGKSSNEAKAVTEEKAVDVGNKICPVSGEKIAEGNKVQYEYEGKVYNFCCPMCIDKFKKDPEKYIKSIKQEKAAAQQEQMPKDIHSGHHH